MGSVVQVMTPRREQMDLCGSCLRLADNRFRPCLGAVPSHGSMPDRDAKTSRLRTLSSIVTAQDRPVHVSGSDDNVCPDIDDVLPDDGAVNRRGQGIGVGVRDG